MSIPKMSPAISWAVLIFAGHCRARFLLHSICSGLARTVAGVVRASARGYGNSGRRSGAASARLLIAHTSRCRIRSVARVGSDSVTRSRTARTNTRSTKTGYRYRGRAIGHPGDGDTLSYSIGSTLVQSGGPVWNVLLRYMEINREGLAEFTSHADTDTARDVSTCRFRTSA